MKQTDMRFLLLILLTILPPQAFAQSTFSKTIRNSGEAGNVIETTDGGYAFTGVDYVRLGKKESFDLIVVKLTSIGKVEWKKKIKGPAANPLMTQLVDGSYVIVDTNVLVRLDSRGNLMWSKTIETGGAIFQGATCIDSAADGGFVVSGERAMSGSLDKLYVLKLNNSGSIEWGRQFAAPGFIDQISHTSDGGFILPNGRWDKTGSIVLAVDLTRLDSRGHNLWNKTIRTTQKDWTLAGNPYVAAATNGSAVFAANIVNYSNHHFPTDIILVQFSSTGQVLWKKKIQTTFEMLIYGVIQAADGNFVLFGKAIDLQGLFLITLSPSGKVLWNQILSTNASNSSGGGIFAARDGGFILSGSQNSYPGEFSIYKLNAQGKATSCDEIESTRISVSDVTLSISTSVKTSHALSLKASTKKITISRWSKAISGCNQ